MGCIEPAMEEFVAALLDIKAVKALPKEVLPFVLFKAGLRGKELKGDETVAIFLIASTSCYIPVFLEGKGLDEVEEELRREGGARLNAQSRELLAKALAT